MFPGPLGPSSLSLGDRSTMNRCTVKWNRLYYMIEHEKVNDVIYISVLKLIITDHHRGLAQAASLVVCSKIMKCMEKYSRVLLS